MSDLTSRELTRRYAVLFGWDLHNGSGSIDSFTREGEMLLATYRGPGLSGEMVGLYNRFIEDGATIERRRHDGDDVNVPVASAAKYWLTQSPHDPMPRVPFVASSEGVVTR